MNPRRKGRRGPPRGVAAAWATGAVAGSPVTTEDSPTPPGGGVGRRGPTPRHTPLGVGVGVGGALRRVPPGGPGSSPCRPAFGRLPAGTARRSVCAYGRRRLGSRDRTRLVHSHVTVTRCDGARDGDEQYGFSPIKLLGGVTVTLAEEVRAAYTELAAQTGSYVVARAVVVQRYGLTAAQANRYLPR